MEGRAALCSFFSFSLSSPGLFDWQYNKITTSLFPPMVLAMQWLFKSSRGLRALNYFPLSSLSVYSSTSDSMHFNPNTPNYFSSRAFVRLARSSFLEHKSIYWEISRRFSHWCVVTNLYSSSYLSAHTWVVETLLVLFILYGSQPVLLCSFLRATKMLLLNDWVFTLAWTHGGRRFSWNFAPLGCLCVT